MSCPTSPVVLQELPTLPSFTSCPTRVSTSYATSPVVLQVFPHPTLPHQLSCKCSYILHYLTSHPARVLTSYTTSPVVLQVFSHPTLPHQSSYKNSHILRTLPHHLSYKCSHILHYLTGRPTRIPTSYATSPVILQELPTSPVVLQEFPHPILPHQLSRKSFHILRYLTSCPTRVVMPSHACSQCTIR